MGLANEFMQEMISYTKRVNAHPQPKQLEVYGKALTQLSAKAGDLGVKAVLSSHFIVLRRADNYQQNLIMTNKDFHMKNIVVNGKPRIKLIHPDQKGLEFTPPRLKLLHQCLIKILEVALGIIWQDGSNITNHEIKTLSQLCGIRIRNHNELCEMAKKIKAKVEPEAHPTSKDLQMALNAIGAVVTKDKTRKIYKLLGILEAKDDKNTYNVTTKGLFVKGLSRIKPDIKQKMAKIPDDLFIAGRNNGDWRYLTDNDVLNKLNELIYFLS